MLIPDRLPSLVLLLGFWVPAALAGRAAAEVAHRSAKRVRPVVLHSVLATFVLSSSAVWFLINLNAMPPYIPGATMDPSYASPEAVRWLAILTATLVLPGTTFACWWAHCSRTRSLERTTA